MMKSIKNVILIITITILFFSCSEEVIVESQVNSVAENDFLNLKRENSNVRDVYYFVGGEKYNKYIDGMLVGSTCLGIGDCELIILNDVPWSSNGHSVPITVSYENDFIEIEFLDEIISMDEIENAFTGTEAEIPYEDIYNLQKNRINIQNEANLGVDFTNSIFPNNEGLEIVMEQGLYPIDYSSSPFGKVKIKTFLEITDSEQ